MFYFVSFFEHVEVGIRNTTWRLMNCGCRAARHTSKNHILWGIAGFYHKYIDKLVDKAKSLTDLVGKGRSEQLKKLKKIPSNVQSAIANWSFPNCKLEAREIDKQCAIGSCKQEFSQRQVRSG